MSNLIESLHDRPDRAGSLLISCKFGQFDVEFVIYRAVENLELVSKKIGPFIQLKRDGLEQFGGGIALPCLEEPERGPPNPLPLLDRIGLPDALESVGSVARVEFDQMDSVFSRGLIRRPCSVRAGAS